MLISPKLEIQPEVVASGTFKEYYERLNKNLRYLGERLEKFRSARLDLLNKDRRPHSFQVGQLVYVVPPQSWGDRSDTKHSKCLLLGGRRLNQLTLIPKPKGSGGTRAATAQVGPANKRNDTKRCLPVEASLRPGEAVPW